MLNEARIKEQYKLALLDQKEEKSFQNLKTFYQGDYISKELIKSFFSGTLTFLFAFAIYLMADVEKLMVDINAIDYQAASRQLIVIYLAFMALYLIITFLVYFFRYRKDKKKQDLYRKHLKKLAKFYQQDEI